MAEEEDVQPTTPTTGEGRPLPDLLSELWELIQTYVRQETVDPIKGVGRFVAYGVAGALLVGVGVVLLSVGVLRVLQAETDTTFTGNLTWIPYGIVFVVMLIGGALSLKAISARREKESRS